MAKIIKCEAVAGGVAWASSYVESDDKQPVLGYAYRCPDAGCKLVHFGVYANMGGLVTQFNVGLTEENAKDLGAGLLEPQQVDLSFFEVVKAASVKPEGPTH